MKIINLKQSGVGRYDDVSPFLIDDKTLELKIILPAVNGEFYLITEINGNKIKKLIPQDGEILLDGLSAGELCAEVKHYLKGELIKTYRIEPLLLKEVDGSLSAEPEITALCRETDELRRTVAKERIDTQEWEENVKALMAQYVSKITSLQTTVNALLRFAYTDYRKNVYLGGESVDGFCKEFSLDLTEEEKKALEEVNENED